MAFEEDVDGDIGQLDELALDEIRTVFETQEPLVTEVGFPSLIDPQELQVQFRTGIGDTDDARLGVRWFRTGYYAFHYTDSSRDFRWDSHPKAGAPDRHFHPPPDAASGDPEPSCITIEEPELVARAVHKLWRRAFDTSSPATLNTADNPS